MLKNPILICFLCPLISYNTAFFQPKQEPVTGVNWDKIEHDFGIIHAGDVTETIYIVSNNRKDTLIIENIQGSCGCVIINWPHQPIVPGSTAAVKVSFNSKGKYGQQIKYVTVYTNKGYFTLSLKAKLIK